MLLHSIVIKSELIFQSIGKQKVCVNQIITFELLTKYSAILYNSIGGMDNKVFKV